MGPGVRIEVREHRVLVCGRTIEKQSWVRRREATGTGRSGLYLRKAPGDCHGLNLFGVIFPAACGAFPTDSGDTPLLAAGLFIVEKRS